ncbi:30S ribosomal protein S16 [Patescibacteria group bacterium]|nr:30S ribosomal protein S16 [Patescibacteria group bacterium]
MLTIRLARIGKKKQPLYRLVINEKTKDTSGDFLEMLGTYNPKTKETSFKAERIKYWISKGASASATVHNLLVSNKIIDTEKVKAWKPKKKKINEEDAKATPPTTSPNAKTSETKPEQKPEEPKKEELKEPEVKVEEKPEAKPEEPKKEEPKETVKKMA